MESKMKTIEEAASNAYCIEVLSSGTNSGVEFGKKMFKAGVEFAQRWIPVEEEYPPIGKLVQVKGNYSDTEVWYSHDTLLCSDEDDEQWDSGDYPTHWRKIELT
jgi:hypothetical protein